MRTSSLYYFKRVAEIGRINAAAEELFVSQSQLSRTIADIEREVGVKLFDRENNNLTLNESGKVFYNYLTKLLGGFNESMERAREAYDVGRTYLSMATNMTSCTAGLVSYLAKKLPELHIKEVPAPYKSCMRLLQNGSVDCVLSAPPLEGPKIRSRVLREGNLMLIFPDGHEFCSRKDSITPEDLADQRYVSMAEGYGLTDVLLKRFPPSAPWQNHVVVETADYRSVIRYVQEGLGCALVPWTLVQRDEFCLAHYADVFPDVTFEMAINWDERHVVRPVEERCVELMEYYCNDPNND